MKKLFQIKAVLLFVFALSVSAVTHAQDKKPIPSPRDSISAAAAGSTITLNYGSPAVKGRKIWGALEPFDKVYRAGANEATRFTTTKDIKVEGKLLAAGTYSFFVIPGKSDSWVVIFNKTANQWGAFNYDEKQDALRVTVKTKTAPMHERLIYTIRPNGFSMLWDTLEIPVSLSK